MAKAYVKHDYAVKGRDYVETDGGDTPGGGGINYSTEERVVGTWIDGKPLYQITVSFTIGSSGTYNTYDTGIDDVSIIASIKGVVALSNAFIELTPYTDNSASVQPLQIQAMCSLSSNHVSIDYRNGAAVVGETCYVTLQYTKTE
jgi:hypothetical protein